MIAKDLAAILLKNPDAQVLIGESYKFLDHIPFLEILDTDVTDEFEDSGF